MISVISACSHVFPENICPYLGLKDLGNSLLVCKVIKETFNKHFEEDPKGLDDLKKRSFTISLMNAPERGILDLLISCLRNNNIVWFNTLIGSGKLEEHQHRDVNLVKPLSTAIKENQLEVVEAFLKSISIDNLNFFF